MCRCVKRLRETQYQLSYNLEKIINTKTMQNIIINISEIEKLFKEYCEENKLEFSMEKFKRVLKFLEVDFYDWVKGNLNQFYKQK